MKTLLFALSLFAGLPLFADVWYVDSERGDDACDGMSPATALKTFKRVSRLLKMSD